MGTLFAAVQAQVLGATKALNASDGTLADSGVEKRLNYVLGGTWIILAILLVVINTLKAYYNERGYQVIWYYTLATSIVIAVVVSLYYYYLVRSYFLYLYLTAVLSSPCRDALYV